MLHSCIRNLGNFESNKDGMMAPRCIGAGCLSLLFDRLPRVSYAELTFSSALFVDSAQKQKN